MFSLLYTIINEDSMKSSSAINPAITTNTEWKLMPKLMNVVIMVDAF